MSVLEAIIMGILQGLTEFLPVSSSGHLEIANYLFGIEAESNLQFTMAVHAATVLSTITVFFRQIVELFKGLFRFRMNEETRYVINLLISMIPIAVVGFFFKDAIEGLFTSNLVLVGIMLLVTACLLTFAGLAKPRTGTITPKTHSSSASHRHWPSCPVCRARARPSPPVCCWEYSGAKSPNSLSSWCSFPSSA